MSAAPPQIKLTYSGLPGRGETARLLFTFGGVAFEDECIAKANFSEFKAKCSLGKVPVLEGDGVLLCQRAAIAHYATTLTDMVSKSLVELFMDYESIRYYEADERAKTTRFVTFEAETVPKFFSALETMVKGAFFGSESASHADVRLFDVVHNSVAFSLPHFSMAACPKLQAIVARVKRDVRIAAYLAAKKP